MLDVQGGRGGGGPNLDNDGQGGRGVNKFNILPDVLGEWPLRVEKTHIQTRAFKTENIPG